MKNGNILLGAVIMPLKGNELKKNEKVFLSLIASDQRPAQPDLIRSELHLPNTII
jgi:hypothetical protein